MSSSAIKNELADHIYQYLCHEAQHSDLPEAAKESLTAASECIEQAYKLNVNNSSSTTTTKQQIESGGSTKPVTSTSIPPDELLRIFTRHKESFLSQHPISQLPMTTRKKLSHLRAQIKRQASKAARSRLEKRSSVAGVTTSSGSHSFGGAGHLSSFISGGGGGSLDTNNASNSKLISDNQANSKDTTNQQSTSSTESPNAYLNNQSTSSPAGAQSGNASGQSDSNVNLNSSSGHHHHQQQNDSSATSSSGAKLSSHLIPGSHHSSIGVSVHQKNFKQKLIALLKKFRTDGSDFDSEEQYREALERELMKAAAGRGSRAIEELLEEEIDVEGESGSETEDWDNISESSTPKPSLRPFFSSTTLDKI